MAAFVRKKNMYIIFFFRKLFISFVKRLFGNGKRKTIIIIGPPLDSAVGRFVVVYDNILYLEIVYKRWWTRKRTTTRRKTLSSSSTVSLYIYIYI